MLRAWNMEAMREIKRVEDAKLLSTLSPDEQECAKHCGLCFERLVEKAKQNVVGS